MIFPFRAERSSNLKMVGFLQRRESERVMQR